MLGQVPGCAPADPRPGLHRPALRRRHGPDHRRGSRHHPGHAHGARHRCRVAGCSHRSTSGPRGCGARRFGAAGRRSGKTRSASTCPGSDGSPNTPQPLTFSCRGQGGSPRRAGGSRNLEARSGNAASLVQ
jgi:hypothetical protein